MGRIRDPNRNKAYEIYKHHDGNIDLVEIASQLNLPAGTIRGWKAKDKWEQQLKGTLQKNTERSKRKRGAQPGNKNGSGPPGNNNAVKHGLFEKYLPEETLDIVNNMSLDPLDILWDQIKIAYAAIVRAQRIAYVKNDTDHTIIQSGYKEGKISGEDYAVQTAIDRQTKFMQAQARAQSELRSLIKQYEELLHANWDMATEEQKQRIELMKINIRKASGQKDDKELSKLDQLLGEIKQQAQKTGGENNDSQS